MAALEIPVRSVNFAGFNSGSPRVAQNRRALEYTCICGTGLSGRSCFQYLRLDKPPIVPHSLLCHYCFDNNWNDPPTNYDGSMVSRSSDGHVH